MSRKLFLRGTADPEGLAEQMRNIGVGQDGIRIMAKKSRHLTFLYRDLDPRGANILKQEMLAAGGEAALSYHAISDWTKPTDVLIMGTERQMEIAMGKLGEQPFGLKQLACEVEAAISTLALPGTRTLNCGDKELELGIRTLIMGILNITPDSFSDGGRFLDQDAAVGHGRKMIEQGADIIDIGGESTRPGAEPVSVDEELKRVIPVIKMLSDADVPISIDTRKPGVAEKAIEAGAGMVNLVGGLRHDAMTKVVAGAGLPVVLLHMLGEPGNMQIEPVYTNVMDDIVDELAGQMDRALEYGIKTENIILDPGIGFGKTAVHNLEIIRRLDEMRILGAPILIGTSRKSFIGKISGMEVDGRLEGSLSSMVLAAANGADIVRVHDVEETGKALAVADAILAKI